MGAAPDHERRLAVSAHYAESGNLAATGRAFGISRERVRQLVACSGDSPEPDGRTRYPVEVQKALAALAVREGMVPVARLARVSEINLRAWVARWHGPSGLPSGRPTLEDAAARDHRIAQALWNIRQSLRAA